MFLDYKAYRIEAYDTHHTGWKARITRLDGQPIKTHPDGREHPFIETLIYQNHEDALAEAKKLIDDGGMN